MQVGDVITKIDDTTINTSDDVATAMGGLSPGDKVTVTINRKDDEQELEVTLGSRRRDVTRVAKGERRRLCGDEVDAAAVDLRQAPCSTSPRPWGSAPASGRTAEQPLGHVRRDGTVVGDGQPVAHQRDRDSSAAMAQCVVEQDVDDLADQARSGVDPDGRGRRRWDELAPGAGVAACQSVQ